MPLVRHKIKRYGWVPDTPDQRDHLYAAPVARMKTLARRIDLRRQCPRTIYDQGQLGSCTGNAIGCAIQFERLKQKRKPDFIPSRLFIYYNERDMEGTITSDSGAQIQGGVVSAGHPDSQPDEGLPRVRLFIRIRLFGLRQLRKRCGGEDGHGA